MWQRVPHSEAAECSFAGTWDNPSGKGREREKWMELKNSLFASLRKTVGQQKAA